MKLERADADIQLAEKLLSSQWTQSRYGDDIVAAREDVLRAVQIYYRMRKFF